MSIARRVIRHLALVVSVPTLLALTACGGGSGGGGGGGGAPNDLVVRSTALTPMLSGQAFDHPIEVSGGCKGPYRLDLLSGDLPPGLRLDDDTRSIVGTLLEDGRFDFAVRVTDTGCQPFLSGTARFTLSVGVGDLVVVDVYQDGNPGLVPAGSTPQNPDYPMLPDVVYNDFTSLAFLLAGGQGPYSMEIVDDPNVSGDGPLPLGVSVVGSSTSLVGAPVETKAGGFLMTFQVEDSIGNTTNFTTRWRIDTPPIVTVTEALPGARAGDDYGTDIVVAEGVPPFEYELVAAGLPADYTFAQAPDDADVVYDPAGEDPPTVSVPGALDKIDASVYPPADAAGPSYDGAYAGAPPEGLRLDEATGHWAGVPRRRGSFLVHIHVHSTLVANSFGQHSWRSYPIQVDVAPPLAQDPAYLVDAAAGFSSGAPFARIPPAEKPLPYSLQLLAGGGVSKDGWTDAPHQGQAVEITGDGPAQEAVGAYEWAVDWDPQGDGGSDPVPGMSLVAQTGEFYAPVPADLVPQYPQEIAFTCTDEALPLQVRQSASETVSFGIGPDVAIITESTTGFTASSNNRPLNDPAMTLKRMVLGSSGTSIGNLGNDDLPGRGPNRIGLPAEAGTATITSMLSASASLDLLRVSVNPTVWWDDVNALNPRAARPFQHASRNSYSYYPGIGYNGTTAYTSRSTSYNVQPESTAVHLPQCTNLTVSGDPALGVYTDGGQLYAFDSSTHFGIFIIREDGRVYVPAAFDKSSSGFQSFGDNWVSGYSATADQVSLTKIPQMTVSPDGRFASFKLRTRTDFSMYEEATNSRILLISLTGERIAAWGGAVYKIIGTGSSGASTGRYQFASSLTLTNRYLYYLIGSGSTDQLHWKDHWIYRYHLLSGASAGALLHSDFNANWTNAPGKGMQTPFQCFDRSFGSSTSGADQQMISSHGYNAFEASLARSPFRVNADGNACAILAAPTTANTVGNDVMNFFAWVDYQGALAQLSTQARHHINAGGRGTALRHGPNVYPCAGLWGAYNGPTTGFEISDDGLLVGATCSREDSVTANPSATSQDDWGYREDIYLWKSTGGTPWSSSTETNVTGAAGYEGTSNSPTNAVFETQTWKFGALAFTRAGDGLVFWAGYHNNAPTSTSAYYRYGEFKAKWFVGSLYSYSVQDGAVRNILPSSAGGCSKTVGSALSTVSFSTSALGTDGGVIKPWGGFYSMNGDFLYIVNKGALSSSLSANAQLVGVNLRSLDTDDSDPDRSLNGHPDGRAFHVTGLPSRRGFYVAAYYLADRGIGDYDYDDNYQQYYSTPMSGFHVAATNNGRVFFLDDEQVSGTSSSTYYKYGGPILGTTYGYGYDNAHVWCFDPNVGGAIQAVTGTEFGPLSGGQNRGCVSLEVSPDGRDVAVVYTSSSSSYTWQYERLAVYSNIQLDPATGAMLPGTTHDFFEPSSGRISASLSFDPLGQHLYYARGSTNEASKILRRGTLGSGGSTSDLSPTPKRYNVLHVGR